MRIRNRKDRAQISWPKPPSWLWVLFLISVLQPAKLKLLWNLELWAAGFGQAAGESARHVSDLIPGESIDRVLPEGQVHAYKVELLAERFLQVNFYSSNIDLLVSLARPLGQKSIEWIIPKRVPTPISWIVDVQGTYQLNVRSLENVQTPGNYQLETKALRVAAARDQKQVAACRALSDATELRQQWTRQSLTSAIGLYEKALRHWQAIADRPQEAATLKSIGDVWEILSQQRKALASFRKARALCRELKDQIGEVKTLNAISAFYIYRGEFQKALEIYMQEPATIDDVWEKAHRLHNLGAAHYGTNEMQKAMDFLNEALRLRRAMRDRSGEAETLLYLGYVHHAIKDTTEAELYYQESLKLWSAVKNPRGQALTLTALGHLSSILGERQRAIGYYDQSIEVFRTIGELSGQCSVLKGMAYLYSALGEKEKALHYYLEALGLARRANDLVAEGNTLDYISGIYRELGDYKTALQYAQQAVLMNRSLPSVLGEAYALANLGRVLEALWEDKRAMEGYARALDLCQKGGDPFLEGLVLNAIGHLYHGPVELSKALDYYQQALSLQQKVHDSVRLPSTLYNLALAERDQGNLDRAVRYAEQALDITESLRGKVASGQLRGSFLASTHQQYELKIDLLMRLHKQRPSEGFDTAGLQASEGARARSLLDMLTDARLDIRQGIAPELLEREASLQRLLNAKAEHQARLLSGKPEEKQSAALAKEISDLTNEYEQVQGQIRSKSPRYAALMQPQPLALQEIQQQVLDHNTLLLEYALGDERSYLWAVTQTAITSHELPKSAEIEKAARQVYDLLIARQPRPAETVQQYNARVTQADLQYWPKAALLSQTLLGPVADQLGNKRLLIVADGALQYLPFAALPKPTAGGERVKGESQSGPKTEVGGTKGQEPGIGRRSSLTPLMVDHEVVNLPSASVMAVLRRETRQRKAGAKAVAVLADPVFEADDPRLKRTTVTRQPVESESARSPLSHLVPRSRRNPASAVSRALPSPRLTASARPLTELHRALRDVGLSRDGLNVPRLLSTRREAEAIFSVAPMHESLKALGFDASRATATSPELAQYRIIHFATHGLINNEHPELSGLVLSLFDEQGRPRDGFLRLHDIYNLKLPADLVVLSACNTGLGKDVRGEGLVGTVRGFMYAGAARVVASLWKVDDEATAELMKRFYRHMLQANLPPAAALRAAQVEMWKQNQWQPPYYWAAFTLQGEWR